MKKLLLILFIIVIINTKRLPNYENGRSKK